MSYVEENLHILKEMINLSPTKRRFILERGGPNLILSFSEIFWNLIHNSNKENFKDSRSIKLIKKNSENIGTLIHSLSSIKKKREILLSNLALQKLALTIGLSGYEFYKQQS